jgi:hypothetical protein
VTVASVLIIGPGRIKRKSSEKSNLKSIASGAGNIHYTKNLKRNRSFKMRA